MTTNNPFDWKNYKPVVSLKDVAIAQGNALRQSAFINRERAQGREPRAIHLPGSQDEQPQKFAVAMPKVPKLPRKERSRAKKGRPLGNVGVLRLALAVLEDYEPSKAEEVAARIRAQLEKNT